MHCGQRYTTYERFGDLTVKVVKKNGVREPFSRDKIRAGLRNACWKRPISDEQIDAIVDAVANRVNAQVEDEVDTRSLGEMVMEKLRTVDAVAYVRFASVYREFKDARDFVSEVSELGTMLPRKRDSKAGEATDPSLPPAAPTVPRSGGTRPPPEPPPKNGKRKS